MSKIKFEKTGFLESVSGSLGLSLVCILGCLAFKFASPATMGKFIFILGFTPFVLMWSVFDIFRVMKNPSLITLCFDLGKLYVGEQQYELEKLRFLHIAKYQSHIALEWEFERKVVFERGPYLKTYAHYEADVDEEVIQNLIAPYPLIEFIDMKDDEQPKDIRTFD